MAFLILGSERYALPIGETRLGGTGDGALPFPELVSVPSQATISVTPDGRSTLRPTGDGAVYVNGTFVTAEGRTLVHGARIDVAGLCLLFGDVEATRQTVHAAAAAPAAEQAAMLAGLTVPEGTASTGGRLTARVGHGLFEIPDSGLDIGRDPSCGVVLLAGDVSRRHARIAPGVLGYVLTDLSANGVLVNGARIDGSRVLGQGDVIRIGNDEWTFTADEAVAEAPPTRPAAVEPTWQPVAAGRPTPALALLATLEIINTGILRGTRFRIERPVVHLGRGAHNDIVLADDSVSSSHARLSRRDATWVVADLDSTNGTYVEGERLVKERVLRGPTELRFGGIKVLFRPIAASGSAMGTRVLGQMKHQ